MTVERIWLLVNKRRAQRGKEPIALTRIQRIARLFWPAQAKPMRPAMFKSALQTAATFQSMGHPGAPRGQATIQERQSPLTETTPVA